jgi:hypothetical protein
VDWHGSLVLAACARGRKRACMVDCVRSSTVGSAVVTSVQPADGAAAAVQYARSGLCSIRHLQGCLSVFLELGVPLLYYGHRCQGACRLYRW